MKNIKNIIATLVLVGILSVSSTFAKGGLLLSDFAGDGQNAQQTCVEDKESKDWGVIVYLTGVIVYLTGNDSQTKEGNTNCGVIVY